MRPPALTKAGRRVEPGSPGDSFPVLKGGEAVLCSIVRRKTIAALTAAAFAAATVLPSQVVAQTGAPAPGEARPDLTYEQAKERLDRMFAALEYLEGKIDKTRFDVEAKAEALGPDVEKIFAFVRDEVRYEPYWGVLRGAKGTLMGRAGNSLDQSVLLAELLKKNGFKTRFAMGRLGDGDAKRLVEEVFEPKTTLGDKADIITLEEVSKLLGMLGLDNSALQRVHSEITDRSEDFAEHLWEDVEDDYALINHTLSVYWVALGTDDDRGRTYKEMVAEAREHFWVQFQDRSGNWINVDPSFGNSNVGEVPADPSYFLNTLPDRLFHVLGLSVILRTIDHAEMQNGGETVDHELLAVKLRVAELVGQSVVLINLPNINPNQKLTSRERIAAISEFTPMLIVGDYDPVIGRSFDFHGRVYDYKKGSLATMLGNFAAPQRETLTSIIGRLTPLTQPTTSKNSTTPPQSDGKRIGGLWATYTLDSPRGLGAEVSRFSVRRDIAKSISIEKWSKSGREHWSAHPRVYRDIEKLKLQLFRSMEIMTPVGLLDEAYLTYSHIATITGNRKYLNSLLSIAYNRSAEDTSIAKQRVRLFPSRLMEFERNSASAAASLAEIRFPDLRSFVNRPGLVIYERRMSAKGAKQATMTEGFDIVRTPVRVFSRQNEANDAEGRSATKYRMYKGIIETAVERHLAQLFVRPANSSPGSWRVSNNIKAVFDAAAKNDVRLVLLRGDEKSLSELEQLEISENAKADIEGDLRRGAVVIVPEKFSETTSGLLVGWWRIDPTNGDLLGIMEGGRGQDLTERFIIHVLVGIINVGQCMISANDWTDVGICGFAGLVSGFGGILSLGRKRFYQAIIVQVVGGIIGTVPSMGNPGKILGGRL